MKAFTDEEVADLLDAVVQASDDLSYRANAGQDYETEDIPAIKAKLARWAKLTEKLAPTDRAFHELNAELSQTDPEGALAELDARYHDQLPEGTNCSLCGVEHAAINPSNLRS